MTEQRTPALTAVALLADNKNSITDGPRDPFSLPSTLFRTPRKDALLEMPLRFARNN
jgi:hypothetical protein